MTWEMIYYFFAGMIGMGIANHFNNWQQKKLREKNEFTLLTTRGLMYLIKGRGIPTPHGFLILQKINDANVHNNMFMSLRKLMKAEAPSEDLTRSMSLEEWHEYERDQEQSFAFVMKEKK